MILTLLIVSNVAAILADWTSAKWTLDSSKIWPYLYLECFFCYLRDSLFNLAHWVFCYKYWSIAVEMQHLLEGRQMNKTQHTVMKACNVFFISLDLLLPVLYEASFFKIWHSYDSSSDKTPSEYTSQFPVYLHIFVWSGYSRGVLLLISAGFLYDSIRRIKQAIKSSKVEAELNENMVNVHLSVLGLYILCIFVYYIAFTIGSLLDKPRAQLIMYWTWDACIIGNFIQQVFLMWLFWNFAQVKA